MRELLGPAGRLTGWSVLAIGVAVVAVLTAAASAVLQLRHDVVPGALTYWLADVLSAVLFAGVTVIMLPRSRHPVVWIAVAVAVGSGASALLDQAAVAVDQHALATTGFVDDATWSLSWQLTTLALAVGIPGGYAVLGVLPWLVGDGFPRPARVVLGVVGGVTTLLGWLSAATRDYGDPLENVLAVPWAPWQEFFLELGLWPERVCLAVSLLGAVHLVLTWWRARGAEFNGYGWLALGQLLVSAAYVPIFYFGRSLQTQVAIETAGGALVAAQAFLPLALVVVVLGRRLWGVDVAVSRVGVWSLLTGAVLASYAALLWLLGMVLPDVDGLAGFLAIGLLVAVGQPLRFWVQERVDRLVYGHRADPVRLLTALGRDLTDRATLQSLVDALRAGLRLGGVHVVSQDGAVGATSGRLGHAVQTVPLVVDGRLVGELHVSAPSGVALDARSHRLVQQTVGLVSVALELALVNERLRAATDRVAEVRHEERRMIRRDLHDGMGPALAGVGLGLAAAQRRLDHDPEGAARLLAELETEVERRTEDVRLLARALLPPQLDDGDLGRALEVLADRFRTSGLAVEVDASRLGPVDTRRQVAVYHVAAEAVTNAHRHAGADAVRVRVASAEDGAVVLEVLDDGTGLAPGPRSGVGLQSMRERSAELGGELEVGPRGDRPGTRVRMVLP